MLTLLPDGAPVRLPLRRLAHGFRPRLGPAQVGLLRHVRPGYHGIEMLRGGARDLHYLNQGMALWREVADMSANMGPGTWAVWDGGAAFLGLDGGLAVEADVGPAGRFAPPGVLAAVARLVHAGGPNLWLGLGSGHARLEGARAAAAAGVGPEDLLRGCAAGVARRLAPAPAGVAVATVGPVRIWASGTGLPGAWVLEGVADA
jgi:hypothetical protein